MIKQDELELRRIRLVDDEGNIIGLLSDVSVVDDPAIQLGALWLNAAVKSLKFAAARDKPLIVGPALRANFPIVQKDKDREGNWTGKWYNAFFSEADVRAGSELFITSGNHNRANFNHKRLFSDQIQMVESWIVEDPECDKAKALGYDMSQVKKGDWFMTYKVLDSDLWEEMKAANFEGFSVEVMGYEEKVADVTKDFAFSSDLDELEKLILSSPSIKDETKLRMFSDIIKDITFSTELNDEAKYRLIKSLLNKI